MVDASLARFIARDAYPIAAGLRSDGSCRADLVAVAIVHVVIVCAVIADEIFSASETAFRAAHADSTHLGVSIVAFSLAERPLKEQRGDAAVAKISS